MFVELYNYLVYNAFDIWHNFCYLLKDSNCLDEKT